MRRRSSTVPAATQTLTRPRHRSVSKPHLAAFASPRSKSNYRDILSLPNELLSHIIACASCDAGSPGKSANRLGSTLDSNEACYNARCNQFEFSTLRRIALTCHRFMALANVLLYGTVTLNEVKISRLFSRTVLETAHRGITLSSPTTTHGGSSRDHLLEGKFVKRLALEYPFLEQASQQRNRSVIIIREFLTSIGAIIGITSSAPSVASPVLASLRTLLIDTSILDHISDASPLPPLAAADRDVSPKPSEVVLSTYLRARPDPLPSTRLTSLTSHLTHLIIAGLGAKWSPPSVTVDALSAIQTLSHVALPRRANGNEDNDDEFVDDVKSIIEARAHPRGALTCVVLVVEPDAGFELWKTYRERFVEQDDNSEASAENYLSSTHVWARFTDFARTVNRERSRVHMKPLVHVVPGDGSAWQRALSNHHRSRGAFDNQIYSTNGRGMDLWRWAETYHSRQSASQ
jgi:hypothetical protein